MASRWRCIIPGGGRRRQTFCITISAIIPFMFIIFFLLSFSQPSMRNVHSPDTHDQVEFETPHEPPAHSDPPLRPQPTHRPIPPVPPKPPVQPDQPASNIVRASTGYYTGKFDPHFPDVREFLNVPYAESTAGKNRFMPPVPVSKSDDHHDATAYGRVCPQFISALPSIWSEQIPWYRIPHEASEKGETAALSGEDCLSVAIWTPSNATENSKLPVAMFWPGGGFQTNGILVPAHQPAQWVSRSQSHVVVTINYRLGILGFPDAAGAKEQNLGLLDQRLALEWVKDNINSFGGDAAKIMVWGFSAGAQAVDFHNYAYYEDPIARSFFSQSGSCLAFGSGHVSDHSKFTFVAKKFGCEFEDEPVEELTCMQEPAFRDIVDFIGLYHGDQRLRFGPVTDQRTVFSDYKERYAEGKVSQVPMIYSSAANDGAVLASYNAQHPESGPGQETVNTITQRILCGAAESSRLRHGINLTTYRYQYAGVWPNQNPLSWMGAYHSSDLPMLFGTYDVGTGDSVLPMEIETSEKMQDFLLSFLHDPHHIAGWPEENILALGHGDLLRFGAKVKPVQRVDALDVDGVCYGSMPYDPFP